MKRNRTSSKDSDRTQGKTASERFTDALPSALGIAMAFDEKLLQEGIEPYGIAVPGGAFETLSREQHASAVLTLHPAAEGTLAEAFRNAHLDPENPWHWKALLTLFVKATFPPANKNTYWTASRYMSLLLEEERARLIHPKGGPKLKKAIIDWYKRETGDTFKPKHVEKLLREARNPEVNTFLKVVPMAIANASAMSAERITGLPVTPEALSERLDRETRVKLALRQFKLLLQKSAVIAPKDPSLSD